MTTPDATGRPTIKCWTITRVGAGVEVGPLRVGVAEVERVAIAVRVAAGKGVDVGKAVGV